MRHTRIGFGVVIVTLGIVAGACGGSTGNVSTTNPGSGNSGSSTSTTSPAPTTTTSGHPSGWG